MARTRSPRPKKTAWGRAFRSHARLYARLNAAHSRSVLRHRKKSWALSAWSLSGLLRGPPFNPLGGSAQSTSSSKIFESCTWAPVSATTSKMPSVSTRRCSSGRACRSLRGWGRSSRPPFGRHARRVQRRPRQVEDVEPTEIVQQHLPRLVVQPPGKGVLLPSEGPRRRNKPRVQ